MRPVPMNSVIEPGLERVSGPSIQIKNNSYQKLERDADAYASETPGRRLSKEWHTAYDELVGDIARRHY